MDGEGRAPVQRLQLPHAARRACLPHGAGDIADPRALRDPQAHGLQDRPGGARRRPQVAPDKAGTPTMGGALILLSIGITTLLWGDLGNRFLWVVLLVTLAFGTIGWIDDYRKVVHRDPKGLSARAKFFWQSVFGVAAACYLGWLAQSTPALNTLIVPFFKFIAYPLGAAGFVVLSYFVIVGTSNAVNLTDGLDGLAIMPTVMVGGALGI